ncbi:MAG: DUF5107 domain-containing protein [Arachnia sp.]
MAVPSLAASGELVLDSGGGRLPTPEESALLDIGDGHAERPSTALPYRLQDGYDRGLVDVEQRVAVLDNGRLRAEFLLDLGGRLWSLRDLTTGRELLHQPDDIQLANLAVRNAWFAGGVEWNLGVTGHWGLTCEPVCAEVVGDVLRMWAHERLLGLTWRLEAWLPPGSDALFTHVTIHNPHAEERPVYWWSNMAVPQDDDTRIVVDAERAYHFGYVYRLSEVTVPLRDGHGDVSWPQRHRGSADYFYQVPGPHPWIASVGPDGYGLAQASTPLLAGRKLFTWGGGDGGRTWQSWLSGSGAYAEIQAGLTPTQLEHLRLAPGETWRFTESYRPVQVADPCGDYTALVTRTREAAVDGPGIDRAHQHFVSQSQDPAPETDTRFRGGSDAQGWGALEIAAGHLPFYAATPYDVELLTDEQRAWLELARTGRLDASLQTSAMTDRQWREHLLASPVGWLRDLLLGHAEHAAGRVEDARRLWASSAAEHPTPDAHRALGLTTAERTDGIEDLLTAHRLAPTRARIAVEVIDALLASDRPADARKLIDNLPAEVRLLPRIQYFDAWASVRLGEADRAQALLAGPLVLPDLREGDLGLDQLWSQYQLLRGTDEPLPGHYDFRMDIEEESTWI